MSTTDASPPTHDWIVNECRVLSIRLSLAQAMVQLLMEGYDALRTHNIDYRTLPSWQDSSVLDRANKMPIDRAQEQIMTWIGKVGSEIRAKVRRQNMRLV